MVEGISSRERRVQTNLLLFYTWMILIVASAKILLFPIAIIPYLLNHLSKIQAFLIRCLWPLEELNL